MRTGRTKIIMILLGVVALSCSKLNPGDCFTNAGPVSLQTRTAEPFRYLHMKNNVDVFLTWGQEYSIQVKAGKNIIPGIKTTIDRHTLTISNENTCNWLRSYESPLEVYISAPALDSIVYRAFLIVYPLPGSREPQHHVYSPQSGLRDTWS